MPNYYDPYTRTNSSNQYKSLGSGYYQDLKTGQVNRIADRGSNKGQFYQVEDKTENIYETRFGRANRFNNQLKQYQAGLENFRNDYTQKFQQASQYQGAQAAAGIQMAANQFGQRRGLGDEFTGAIAAEQIGKAQQQIIQSNLDMQTKLSQLTGNAELGFIDKEFDYIRNLELMDYNQELSKDMARFQADLQSDYGLQQALGDLMQIGGTALGLGVFNLGGNNQQQQAPYNAATQYRINQAAPYIMQY